MIIDALGLLWDLVLGLGGPRRSRHDVRAWARSQDQLVVHLRRIRRPGAAVRRPFGSGLSELLFDHRYYAITTIDGDHVRRTGVARARDAIPDTFVAEPPVEVVWLGAEQLDWRDRPPRRALPAADGAAQGWCADHTGRHEQRWYSSGAATEVVRDGASESRDPLPGPPAP